MNASNGPTRMMLVNCGKYTFADVDLTDPPLHVDQVATVVAQQRGDINAFVCWFELDLSPQHTLDCSPFSIDDSCHWKCPVWLLPEPRSLNEGEAIELRYHRALTRARLDVLA